MSATVLPFDAARRRLGTTATTTVPEQPAVLAPALRISLADATVQLAEIYRVDPAAAGFLGEVVRTVLQRAREKGLAR